MKHTLLNKKTTTLLVAATALGFVATFAAAPAHAAVLQHPYPISVQVQPGETISEIARDMTGSVDNWPELALINGVFEPTELRAGRDILVPATVVVEPGDTLTEISDVYTPNPQNNDDIAYVNWVSDPTNLTPGETLFLSERNTPDPEIVTGLALQIAAEPLNNVTEQFIDEQVAELTVFDQ